VKDKDVVCTVNKQTIEFDEVRFNKKRKFYELKLDLFEFDIFPSNIILSTDSYDLDLMKAPNVKIITPTIPYQDFDEIREKIQHLTEKQDIGAKAQHTQQHTQQHTHDILDIDGLQECLASKVEETNRIDKLEKTLNELNTRYITLEQELAKTREMFDTKDVIMRRMIKNKQYIHVGKMEMFQEPDAKSQTTVWIKLITNINFNSPLTQFTSLGELEKDPFNITCQTDERLNFVQGNILPHGPKLIKDYPIGNKMYEWLESEIHLQFKTDNLIKDKESLFSLNFNDIELISVPVTKYDNTDWYHYYLHYITKSSSK